jgi:prepilin-type processing-associated H-X9-DG protein
MLLPALGKAREAAKSAICKNNLKQFGLGANQYSNDYDDYTLIRTDLGRDHWYDVLGMYLGLGNSLHDVDVKFTSENTIYTCGSHRWREGSNKGVLGNWGRCYGINFHFSSNCVIDYFGDGKIHPKTTMVKNPTSLIYFLESDNHNILTSDIYKVYGDPTSGFGMADGGYKVEKKWHNGMPNQLRFDGHVDNAKWYTLKGHSTTEGAAVWDLDGRVGGSR